MIQVDQSRAFVDHRTVKFHVSFLKAVVSPEHRGRHRVLLEEPGWRILIWCLVRGMSRSFRRRNMPALPRGVHACIGVAARTAESLGLDEKRFLRHVDRGVAAGIWRVVINDGGTRRYLELSPEHFWIGDYLSRDRAMKAWGLDSDSSHFLQVGGDFLRQVLQAHATGSGIGSANPIVMTPGDWRFLFQAVLSRRSSGLRWEGRPAEFKGSLREIAKRLSLSHTALREQLQKVAAWESSLAISSPMSVDCWNDDHPQRPGIAGLLLWINPLWFRTPPKKKKPVGPDNAGEGGQTVIWRSPSNDWAVKRWYQRFKRRT